MGRHFSYSWFAHVEVADEGVPGDSPVIDLYDGYVLVMPDGASNQAQNYVTGIGVTDEDAEDSDAVTWVYHTDVGTFKFWDNGGNEAYLSDLTLTGNNTATYTVSGPWLHVWQAFSDWDIDGSLDLNIASVTETDVAGTFSLAATDADGHTTTATFPIITLAADAVAFRITHTGTADATDPIPSTNYTIFPSGTWELTFNDATMAAATTDVKVRLQVSAISGPVPQGTLNFTPAVGTHLTIVSQTAQRITFEASCAQMKAFMNGTSGDVLTVTPLVSGTTMLVGWVAQPVFMVDVHDVYMPSSGTSGLINPVVTAP